LECRFDGSWAGAPDKSIALGDGVLVDATDFSATIVASRPVTDPREAVTCDKGVLYVDCESRFRRRAGFRFLLNGRACIGVIGVGLSDEFLLETGVRRCAVGMAGGVPL
jgi:hypothetical protein